MPNPMRIIEGAAKPHEPFWTIRNAAESESGEPEMEFYGFISEYSWFEDDITPKKFKDDLTRIGGGGPITIRMNSGGGDVFAASVIRSILVEYPGQVTVRIDGLAASAATIVATAGDVIRMQDTAYMMIHDPSAFAWGTIEDLKEVLSILKTVKDGIMDAYEGRTKLGKDKLSKMMTDETWMTAHEAKDLGFIDEVIGGGKQGKKAPKNVAVLNALQACDLSKFQNVPEALCLLLSGRKSPVENQAAVEPPDVARLRAEVRLLV